MRMGFAEVDVTPQIGEEMSGYGLYLNRRARAILDPLMARALVMEWGSVRAVLVQLDLIGVSPSFVTEIRETVQRRWQIPSHALMIHCIHTHSGPASFPYRGCGHLCVDYMVELRVRILQAIGSALSQLHEVSQASWFDEPFRGIGYARAGSSSPDSHVRGIFFQLSKGCPVCLISYACHPVVLGRNDCISADYPGRVVKELNAYGIHALFLNGPCGDIDPLSNAQRWGAGTEETLNVYGRDIAQKAHQGIGNARPFSVSGIRFASRLCEIRGHLPSSQELETRRSDSALGLEQTPEDGRLRLQMGWAEEMLRRHKEKLLSETMLAEVQCLSLGDVAIVGLAGEVFTEIGRFIRTSHPSSRLLISATTNGLLGYIPTREDVESTGYASDLACKIYDMLTPQPGEGERFAEQAAEVVREALTS